MVGRDRPRPLEPAPPCLIDLEAEKHVLALEEVFVEELSPALRSDDIASEQGKESVHLTGHAQGCFFYHLAEQIGQYDAVALELPQRRLFGRCHR